MVVFSSSSCPFCQKALAALKDAGYTPTVVEDFDRSGLAAKCGGSTSVPKALWMPSKWLSAGLCEAELHWRLQ